MRTGEESGMRMEDEIGMKMGNLEWDEDGNLEWDENGRWEWDEDGILEWDEDGELRVGRGWGMRVRREWEAVLRVARDVWKRWEVHWPKWMARIVGNKDGKLLNTFHDWKTLFVVQFNCWREQPIKTMSY